MVKILANQNNRMSPSQKNTNEATFARQLLIAAKEILLLIDGTSMQILHANDAAMESLGYPYEELVGMDIHAIECALSDIFFWDEMRGRESASAESSYRCADGSLLEGRKHVTQVSEQPLRFAVAITKNENEHKSAQDLDIMSSHLRATLEATAEGILMIDNDGNIVNMNRRFSALWQLPNSLLEEQDDGAILSYIHAQVDHSENRADHEDLLRTQDQSEILHLRDGRTFECASYSALAHDQLIGRVYSYRDLTEQHKAHKDLIAARDEAERANQAKSAFLAMMSHEIRTPMNGVLGITQMLEDTDLTDEQAAHVRLLRASGQTLMAVINDILDYSKIEAGKMELELTDFALTPLFDEIKSLFRFRQKDGGPTLDCSIAADVPDYVNGDPVRLRQILFNLIGNAFKFTEQGSIKVTVTKTATPHLLYFSVKDTGIGIASDRLGRVFEAFEQAESSTTRKFGGTGLGLAICKRLISLQGGEIGVNSVLGQGAEFWFAVKLGAPSNQHSSEAVQKPTANRVPEQVLTPSDRILLVEDNAINCAVMKGALKRLGGGEPVIAGNGAVALAKMAESAFDLILMDSQMPVMDGLEATRRLRAQGFTLPIIGVSAGAMDNERQAALDAGASAYVLKPVDIHALAAILKIHLKR